MGRATCWIPCAETIPSGRWRVSTACLRRVSFATRLLLVKVPPWLRWTTVADSCTAHPTAPAMRISSPCCATCLSRIEIWTTTVTLRCCAGTSRRWLAAGKKIVVEQALTAFGRLSLRAKSRLEAGEISVHVKLPTRSRPQRTLLRVRVPEGYRVSWARGAGERVPVGERGTVDLSGEQGSVNVKLSVTR